MCGGGRFSVEKRLLAAAEELPQNVFYTLPEERKSTVADVINADPDIPPFTYTIKDNEIYFKINESEQNIENAKKSWAEPFVHEESLKDKIKRQVEINMELDLANKEKKEESLQVIPQIEAAVR